MTDPFESLRMPIVPVAPDPAFGARLRARVARALDLPQGVTVSNLTLESDSAGGTGAEPIRQGDVGYVSLWVPDVERAAAFFASVLGWAVHPGSSEQGRHVEGIRPDHGMFGGQERSTLFLCYAVDDIDAALERVTDAGGEAGQVADAPYGRVAGCIDDQGTRFALYQPPPGRPEPRPPINGGRHGDVSYITMEVRDSAKARAFYGAVVGWRFTPGRVEDGWGPEDVAPMTGMHGGHDQATTLPMYRVDDIVRAVAGVRAAGGTSTDPVRHPYGVTVDCVDDQGTRFYLGQF